MNLYSNPNLCFLFFLTAKLSVLGNYCMACHCVVENVNTRVKKILHEAVGHCHCHCEILTDRTLINEIACNLCVEISKFLFYYNL